MAGTVRCTLTGRVATVTLDSAGKLNAVSVAMWRALADTFTSLAGDAALACIVVRGAGGNFAAGADIEEFAAVRHDSTSGRVFHQEILAPALAAIRTVPPPVIAAIEGVCVGGGLEIALACDLRLAVADARLGVPVGRLGFALALPELRLLLQQVGPTVAADLLLTGRLLSGEEAVRVGLVQRLAPRDDLEQQLDQLVAAVLRGAPAAARCHKRQIRALVEDADPDAHDEASLALLDSADYQEGVAAFVAKRRAVFIGS